MAEVMNAGRIEPHTCRPTPAFCDFLARAVAVPARHAAWLQTVSLLEFKGATKIAAYASRIHPDREVLQHLAEESRHALFFRKAAERIVPEPGEPMAAGAAVRYFHGLDGGVRRHLQYSDLAPGARSRASYLAVTLLIEERAMGVYGAYEEVLRKTESPVRLAGILAEEEGHLSEMYSGLEQVFGAAGSGTDFGNAFMHELRGLEKDLFRRFEARLVAEV